MFKKILLSTICIVIIFSLVGCQFDVIGDNNEKNSDQKQNTESLLSQEDDDKVQIGSSAEIQDIINDLNGMGIVDCYAGYRSGGSLSVWVNIPTDIEFIETNYYNPHTAKTIFDSIDNIENTYLWTNSSSGCLDICSRNMYQASILKNAPSDYDEFKKMKIKWSGISEIYGFDKYDICEYVPACFTRLMQQIYGDRLVKAETVNSSVSTIEGFITVDGLPENISVYDEIAKTYVAALGRFDWSFNYNMIENMSIDYKNNGDVLYTSMFMGFESSPNEDYLGWSSVGLNPADWEEYALETSIFDKSINLQQKEDDVWSNNSATYEDPGYAEAWSLLESFDGVKDLFLGYNGNSYVASIILEHVEDEQDFQKEMDMTLLAMKYPFEKIAFFVEDDGEIRSQACIDRERYNILMYMNEDIDNAVFDFHPSDWPLMAKGFEMTNDDE